MAEEWYYSRDKQRHGPVTRAELGDLAAGGQLRPRDLVWADGMTDWRPAQAVEGLLPPAAPPAPVATGEGTPPPVPVPGLDRGQAFVVAGLVGLLVLAVSTFLPWVYGSGIGQREGKLVFLLSASAGAFLVASSLLKEHGTSARLAAAAGGTVSLWLVVGQVAHSLEFRSYAQITLGLFGLVVSLLAALAVCGWFSFLAVTQPVEWRSLQARGLPSVLWRHGSLIAVQLVAVLYGLFSVLR